jgi:DNA polymerase III subunit epsilon
MTASPPQNDIAALEGCAQLLEGSGCYRVLRRLPSLQNSKSNLSEHDRTAIILDTETTGLDPLQDEVIEFAALAVTYNHDGEMTALVDSFSQLREPSIDLSQDVTRLTGITPEMVKGQRLNKRRLDEFVSRAALIVAHNASFDRPFCEGLSDVFKSKPWACSATEIGWKELGFEGAKLAYIVTHLGWFYEAHRALDDCNALAHVLGSKLPNSMPDTPFKHLLASAREIRARLSFSAPFSSRTILRAKGFRWRPSTSQRPGHWFIDVREGELDNALNFLNGVDEIPSGSIRTQRISAFERYRDEIY